VLRRTNLLDRSPVFEAIRAGAGGRCQSAAALPTVRTRASSAV